MFKRSASDQGKTDNDLIEVTMLIVAMVGLATVGGLAVAVALSTEMRNAEGQPWTGSSEHVTVSPDIQQQSL